MTALFVFSVVFCIYTYAGFPLLLHWKARRCQQSYLLTHSGRENDGEQSESASVTIVIAIHNEMPHLPGKIESLDKLDYPGDALSVIFVSDGSSDGSEAYLRQQCRSRSGWQCFDYPEASGKPTALNTGVAAADSEFIVFMDGRQRISSNAVSALIAPMSDPTIGAVSGELMLADDQGPDASNVGLYWRYEKWIRRNESRCFSTTGATGALYAIRREHYSELPADTLLDDFDTPVRLLRHGLRTVFEPAARAYDQAEDQAAGEFRRKARTLTGNFQSFLRHRWLFHPRLNPVWWQFISHKVFRLLVPYALLTALLSSLAGSDPFLRTMFWCQVVFYGLGLSGHLGVQHRSVNIIKVFLQLNAAALVGAWRTLRGHTMVRWKS